MKEKHRDEDNYRCCSVIVTDVPVDLRPDAVQCVLLLLPDEHREALETLLDFLNHVASNAPYNQMTASNLAVCLAPSLFHFNHSNTNVTNRSSSVSPRRRKTVGIPDQRELSENKAAHDCLLYLVKMHRELFMVSGSMPNVQVVREERHPSSSSSRNGDCDRARIREIYTRKCVYTYIYICVYVCVCVCVCVLSPRITKRNTS